MNIRNSLLLGIAVLGVYVTAWTVAYLFFVGANFQFYLQYLQLSWTGPGEIPTLIQATSLAVTALVLVVFFLWRALAAKRKNSSSGSSQE
jgi:hypothetical protein